MLVASLALFASLYITSTNSLPPPITGPLPGQFKDLVTFGDSYTDVVRNLWNLAKGQNERNRLDA